MSTLLELVDSLEVKVQKAVLKLKEEEEKNEALCAELTIKEQKIKDQEGLLAKWEEQYNVLKLTNSMLGSEEYKKETKLKINALIREIDHCISQLSK